jgi:hypothetical protein
VLDITGLPAGAGYSLSTNNLQTNADLTVTIYATNIAQGEYTFSLNGSGGATNSLFLVLQSGYVWSGAGQNVAANWTNNTSWVGGAVANNPTDVSDADVIFGSVGAQTNRLADGISFTNIVLSTNVTVGSIRFAQGTFTNTETTNATFHSLRLANGSALTVTGTKGFRLLRDYISDYGDPDRRTGVNISGGAGSRLIVTNMAADFAILLDAGTGSGESFLSEPHGPRGIPALSQLPELRRNQSVSGWCAAPVFGQRLSGPHKLHHRRI